MSETETRFWDWIDENWFWLVIFGQPALAAGIAYLAEWPPAAVIGLTAVLLVAAIVTIGLAFWRQVRLRQADAALKQALLQRELSVEEIERLLTCPVRLPEPPAPPPTEEQALENLAASLHASEVPATVIEQVFRAIRSAEPALRPALYAAICGLAGEGGDEATEAEIQAALRGLGANETAAPQAAAVGERVA